MAIGRDIRTCTVGGSAERWVAKLVAPLLVAFWVRNHAVISLKPSNVRIGGSHRLLLTQTVTLKNALTCSFPLA